MILNKYVTLRNMLIYSNHVSNFDSFLIIVLNNLIKYKHSEYLKLKILKIALSLNQQSRKTTAKQRKLFAVRSVEFAEILFITYW